MPGINSGILSNAYPLTAEQIKELEKRAIETNEIFVYLNDNSPEKIEKLKENLPKEKSNFRYQIIIHSVIPRILFPR